MLERYADELPRLFAVVTWGCAGTKWLSIVLNSHPDVFCVHALRNALGAQATTINDEQTLHAVRLMGLGYRLAGEIHGLPRTSIAHVRQRFGEMFSCVGLVRSPVPRLRSQLALFKSMGFSEHIWTGMEYVKTLPGFPVISRHITSRPRLLFVHAVNMLNAIAEEERLLPLYRLEDISSDPSSFRDLVSVLSNGSLEIDEAFAAKAVSTMPANVHSKRARTMHEFDSWQLETIRAILTPESVACYSRLGYDIPTAWLPRASAA